MSVDCRFRKGTEQAHGLSIERAVMPNKAAIIARARAHSRTVDDFVEVHVGLYVPMIGHIGDEIAAVVHTKVIDGVNQFLGDGVITTGSKITL